MSDVKSLFRKKTKQAVRTYPIEGGEGGWSSGRDVYVLCVKSQASASPLLFLLYQADILVIIVLIAPLPPPLPNPTLHLNTGQGQGRARQAVSTCPLFLSLPFPTLLASLFPSTPSVSAPNLHMIPTLLTNRTAEEEEDDEWGVTAKPTEQLYMGDRKAAELM